MRYWVLAAMLVGGCTFDSEGIGDPFNPPSSAGTPPALVQPQPSSPSPVVPTDPTPNPIPTQPTGSAPLLAPCLVHTDCASGLCGLFDGKGYCTQPCSPSGTDTCGRGGACDSEARLCEPDRDDRGPSEGPPKP